VTIKSGAWKAKPSQVSNTIHPPPTITTAKNMQAPSGITKKLIAKKRERYYC
jgi:hypothetical protein